MNKSTKLHLLDGRKPGNGQSASLKHCQGKGGNQDSVTARTKGKTWDLVVGPGGGVMPFTKEEKKKTGRKKWGWAKDRARPAAPPTPANRKTGDPLCPKTGKGETAGFQNDMKKKK